MMMENFKLLTYDGEKCKVLIFSCRLYILQFSFPNSNLNLIDYLFKLGTFKHTQSHSRICNHEEFFTPEF